MRANISLHLFAVRVCEENRNCDGWTALRDTWKARQRNGEQKQHIEGVGDC